MSEPTPFVIDVAQARLDEIRAQVAAFDWQSLPDAGAWEAGVGLADLRRLTAHWLTRFDWRAQERALNRLPQFTLDVDGQLLHYVHARGNARRGTNRGTNDTQRAKLPILLLHGWPGSFVEFAPVIGSLVEDGHDVIVPSLPGYAFSARPSRPVGPRATAALMHRLMREGAGADRYLVQGGDWGATIGGWLAYDQPDAVAALHLNMVLLQAADAHPDTPAEREWAARRAALAEAEAGYSHLQGTRPQTLGVAMSDSPVGVAAWILEKFGVWSDVPRRSDGSPDLWARFDEDLLLTNIMLYLAPRAFVTSTWMYRGRVNEASGTLPAGARIATPTAVAAFPDPAFPPPPRSHAEKTYDVVRWTDMPAGGHFAALEEPARWLADVRAFVATHG